MADYSSLGSMLDPTAGLTNPLDYARQLQGFQSNALNLQKLRAEQAAGEAYQASINPQTGELDPNEFRRQLASHPGAAMAAGTSLNNIQGISSNQLDMQKVKLGWYNGALGALPDNASKDQILSTIRNGVAHGMFSPEDAAREASQVPDDDAGRAAWVQQHRLTAANAMDQFHTQYGTPTTVNAGNQILPGVQAPANRGGAFAPSGQPVPLSMAPGAGGTVEAVVQGPNGPFKVQIPYQTAFPGQVTPAARGTGAGANVPPAGTIPPNPNVPEGTQPGRVRPPPGSPLLNPAASSPIVQTPAGQGVVTSLPVGQQPATEDTARKSADMGSALTARADQVPVNKANYANMLTDLERIGSMPAGGEKEVAINTFLQKATGYGVTMTPDQIAAANSFAKLANIAVGQQLQAIGGTDARQQLFMGSNPNLDLSKLGNQQIIHMLQGNEDAIQAKSRAWQNWLKSGNGTDSYGQFQNDFNHHFDPRVFQSRYMSANEIAALRKSMTGPGETQKFKDDYQYAKDHGWVQ